MGSHQWSSTGQHPSQNIFDHLEDLKADFNSLLNTLEASSSRASKVSSSFRDNIKKGTTNGIAEVERRGQCSKWSEVDKTSIDNIILNNVVSSAFADTQITIPLAQFYNLRKSYQQVHAKLKAQLPQLSATARHSRFDTVGKEAASNVATVNDTQIVEIESYSATITLKIIHQASVNRMEGKGSRHLGEAISFSLEAFFSNDWFRGSIRLSSARLLDTGDVEIIAHAEHRGDLERLIQTTAWHEEFERSLGPLPTQTYKVRMHKMKSEGPFRVTFTNRKEKSTFIKTLTDINFPVESDNDNRTIMGDLSWSDRNPVRKKERGKALVIEFLFPEQANKAIADTMFWQGRRHRCTIAGQLPVWHLRCIKCQHYGHLDHKCSAEPRCGYCAGHHRTKNCTSTHSECVLCGGPHHSTVGDCPAKEHAKNTHRYFQITPELPATEPGARAHVAIKMEPEQSEPMFHTTQEGHTTAGTRLQQTEDLRIVARAGDSFQPSISIDLKREAEDALPEGESVRDAKRIKQEDLKQENPPYREDSMPRYRQPSPFIIHRPD